MVFVFSDLIQVVMKDYADGFPVVLEAAREKMKMVSISL